MKIIDPRDFKIYDIKDLEVVYHSIPSKDGELESVKCMEYIVIGKNSEWEFWMLYKDFEKANSKIAKELEA